MENTVRINPEPGGHPSDTAADAVEKTEQKHDALGLLRSLEERLNEPHVEEVSPAKSSRTPKRIFKALVGVAIIALFGWLPMQALWQTSSVEAVVNSRLVTLRAPIDGKVVSTNFSSSQGVVEQSTVILRIVNSRGDRVRLDDLRRQRARLENERPAIAAKLASAQAAQKDLAHQAAQFKEGRIRQLEARIAESESSIDALVARREEATAAVERSNSLVRSGSVSTVELARLTREQTIAQRTELAARNRLDATRVELDAARDGTYLGDSYNDRPSSVQREEEMRQRVDTLTADLGQADSEIGWLSSEIGAEEFRYNNLAEAEVRLPVTGRIWEIMTSFGEDVRAGQPLARVLDCSSTVVTANVTERVYNRLQIGAPARFRPADGSDDIEGIIVNLTGSAGAAANLAISPDALSKEPYRVTVSVPYAGSAKDCKVGRTGRVIFGNPPAQPAP